MARRVVLALCVSGAVCVPTVRPMPPAATTPPMPTLPSEVEQAQRSISKVYKQLHCNANSLPFCVTLKNATDQLSNLETKWKRHENHSAWNLRPTSPKEPLVHGFLLDAVQSLSRLSSLYPAPAEAGDQYAEDRRLLAQAAVDIKAGDLFREGVSRALYLLKTANTAANQPSNKLADAMRLLMDALHSFGVDDSTSAAATAATNDPLNESLKAITSARQYLPQAMDANAQAAISKNLDDAEERIQSLLPGGGNDQPALDTTINKIQQAQEIVKHLSEADEKILAGLGKDESGESNKYILDTAEDELADVLRGRPHVRTKNDNPDDEVCARQPPVPEKALQCLESARKHLRDAKTDPSIAKLDTNGHLKQAEEELNRIKRSSLSSVLQLAAIVLLVVSLFILVWLRLSGSKRQEDEDSPSEEQQAVQAAANLRAEVNEFRQKYTDLVQRFKNVVTDNSKIEAANSALRSQLAQFKLQMESSRAAAEPSQERGSERLGFASSFEPEEMARQARSRRMEPPPEKPPVPDAKSDYNLARGTGDPKDEAEFKAKYGPTFSLECANLFRREIAGGQSQLTFRQQGRGSFLAVTSPQGRTLLFPQFNKDYRASQGLMEGIFAYPGGSSEDLVVDRPAWVEKSGDEWILTSPGKLKNAAG